ncbi:MAG: HAMP domain-containing histidine kinase [Clostridia bacterium]|nr:HAMP domain-containing histidine kinase [Clostridia bacterium]
MSIKLKLVLSNILMIFIPVILSVFIAIGLLGYFINHSPFKIHPKQLREIAEKAPKTFLEVRDTLKNSPDKFRDKEYLKSLEGQLSLYNTGIMVKKENDFIHTSPFLDSEEIYQKILEAFREEDDKSSGHFIMKNKAYHVIAYDTYFSDKTPGTLYLITDVAPIGWFAKKYFSTLFWVIIIIVALTNGILTFFVSRSILKPLKHLEYGTVQIKDGNLNFKIPCQSRDEIGRVCIAFEEMRKKLKESIEMQLKYEEDRKELVSNISHDLKTPITSIKGYVIGILDGVADTPEKLEKYAKTIYHKASDIDKLIDDLFLFSKLDLKKVPFNFEPVNLQNFFSDCIDELSMEMPKKGIDLHFEPLNNPGIEVVIDKEKLKRVITNIADNAEKFMDKESKRLTIKLYEEPETVTVEIRDNGMGINQDELSHIFDRFYRADNSRNSSTGGTGLGLAIAKQIIEGHGGKIFAQSEPNDYTSIFFTLRKYKPEQQVSGGSV